jgi:Mrp family chromosome partitioning ATPase
MTKIYEALEQAQQDRAPVFQSNGGRYRAGTLDVEEEMIALHCALHTLIPKQRGRTVQFIGSSEGEGTSTVVREFAKISAEKIGNTVLLVDSNGSSPSQHEAFAIRTENDWLDSIHNKMSVEKAFTQVGSSNIYIGMISRKGDLNPGITQIPEFAGLWKSITERFDLILIDSPPITTSSEGLILSKWVDGVVLVVESERTRWPVVQSSRDKIAAGGGNLLGVVLNKRKFYIPESIYNRL